MTNISLAYQSKADHRQTGHTHAFFDHMTLTLTLWPSCTNLSWPFLTTSYAKIQHMLKYYKMQIYYTNKNIIVNFVGNDGESESLKRFYRTAWMQTRSSDENSVCPSVCQTRALWQLLLITNRKSHAGFRLVPTRSPWMTLNGVIAFILHFSPNLIAMRADYVTVVEAIPIMSVIYCFPVPVFHFWSKLTHPASRSFCDSWASWWIFVHERTAEGYNK